MALNPLEDTSTGTASLPFAALRRIKLQMQELTLHDAWRITHPNTRDYTFFSAPHNRYSRIDYFFISQKDIPYIDTTTIEPMLISDHHPITLKLSFPISNHFTKTWRLDPTLLTDPKNSDKISAQIKEFFHLNDTPDSSPLSQWQSHKCNIRGLFIKLSAKRKRVQQNYTNSLIEK